MRCVVLRSISIKSVVLGLATAAELSAAELSAPEVLVGPLLFVHTSVFLRVASVPSTTILEDLPVKVEFA